MNCIYKHSIIQSRKGGIDPRIINRCVDRAFDGKSLVDEHDISQVPFQRLSSHQPTIPVSNVDVTRRPIAYGRAALPKLRKELSPKNVDVVLTSLTSLCDLVHNPEHAYRAFTLHLINRMNDLVCLEDQPAIRERAYLFLKIMATHAEGKERILNNVELVKKFKTSMKDPSLDVRMKLAACLEEIASFWKTADALVEYGFIECILEIIPTEDDQILPLYLETLKSLLYCDGKTIALNLNAFDTLVKLLDRSDPEIVGAACECLMMLTSTYKGQLQALNQKLLDRLMRLLHSEDPKVYAAAASVIMFCTIRTEAKIEAGKIKSLTKRLLDISKSSFYPSAQIYGIKALTNIAENSHIRKLIKEKYGKEMHNIDPGDNINIQKHKDTLIMTVGWVPQG